MPFSAGTVKERSEKVYGQKNRFFSDNYGNWQERFFNLFYD
jgi:hypothetical protein